MDQTEDAQLQQLDDLQLPDPEPTPAPVTTEPEPELLPEEHRRYGVYDETHQRFVGEVYETYEQAVTALEQATEETGHAMSVEPV